MPNGSDYKTCYIYVGIIKINIFLFKRVTNIEDFKRSEFMPKEKPATKFCALFKKTFNKRKNDKMY